MCIVAIGVINTHMTNGFTIDTSRHAHWSCTCDERLRGLWTLVYTATDTATATAMDCDFGYACIMTTAIDAHLRKGDKCPRVQWAWVRLRGAGEIEIPRHLRYPLWSFTTALIPPTLLLTHTACGPRPYNYWEPHPRNPKQNWQTCQQRASVPRTKRLWPRERIVPYILTMYSIALKCTCELWSPD